MTDRVNGCRYCGKDRRDHAQEKHDGREGFETWVEPTDEQRKARLLARSAPSADYLDVLFDGPPSHESGLFVEVNDPSGASVNAGEWIERGDGLWVLRIPRLAPATEDEAAAGGVVEEAARVLSAFWPVLGDPRDAVHALADAGLLAHQAPATEDEAAETVAKVHAFCSKERTEIRTQFRATGGAPARYLGYADACDDVLAMLGASR